MEITLVKVFPVHEDKLKAFVSIVIDNCFMVNDIKVIQGKDRLFLSMPSRRKKTGEFKDVAHPLNEETRNLLEERVLGEYWRVVEEESTAVEEAGSIPQAPPPKAQLPPTSPSPSAPSEVVPLPPVRLEAPAPPAGGEALAASDGRQGAVAGERAERREPSLEEVQEKHLQDSFWSVR